MRGRTLTEQSLPDYLNSNSRSLLLVDAGWNKDKTVLRAFRDAAKTDTGLFFWECDAGESSLWNFLRQSSVRGLPVVILRQSDGETSLKLGRSTTSELLDFALHS